MQEVCLLIAESNPVDQLAKIYFDRLLRVLERKPQLIEQDRRVKLTAPLRACSEIIFKLVFFTGRRGHGLLACCILGQH